MESSQWPDVFTGPGAGLGSSNGKAGKGSNSAQAEVDEGPKVIVDGKRDMANLIFENMFSAYLVCCRAAEIRS